MTMFDVKRASGNSGAPSGDKHEHEASCSRASHDAPDYYTAPRPLQFSLSSGLQMPDVRVLEVGVDRGGIGSSEILGDTPCYM